MLSVGLRINDSSSLIVCNCFFKKLEYFSGKKVESVCFLLNGFVKKRSGCEFLTFKTELSLAFVGGISEWVRKMVFVDCLVLTSPKVC